MAGRRFVLLDRDGTVLVFKNYLSRPDQVELAPGAAEGLRRMAARGFGLVVVTNQSGLARGYFDEATLTAIHDRMLALLLDENIVLDGIYWCPHLPSEGCDCRKPETALARRAASEHGFDLADCVVIGDNDCDVALGQRLGVRTILVRTGHGADLERAGERLPPEVVDDLTEAATLIAPPEK